ncbi:hypothetical protein A2U01_0108754, partial [Trifolium medium]|nr:hypothetical protein [Trifolium medium]
SRTGSVAARGMMMSEKMTGKVDRKTEKEKRLWQRKNGYGGGKGS